jgi:hypothetical protein
VIGAVPQRVNCSDDAMWAATATWAWIVILALVVPSSSWLGLPIGVLSCAALIWWLIACFRRTQCWLHLSDPEAMRIAGRSCDGRTIPRDQITRTSIEVWKPWQDFLVIGQSRRAHIVLHLRSGEVVELRRFWRRADRAFGDPHWKLAEVLRWAGAIPPGVDRFEEHR